MTPQGKCRKFWARTVWRRRALPCLDQGSIFRTLPRASRAKKIYLNPRSFNAAAIFGCVPVLVVENHVSAGSSFQGGRQSLEQTSISESGQGAHVSRRQIAPFDLQRSGTGKSPPPQNAKNRLPYSNPEEYPQPDRHGHVPRLTKGGPHRNGQYPPRSAGRVEFHVMMLKTLFL